MAKDYAKFVPKQPRSLKYRGYRLPLLIALFLTVAAFAFLSFSLHSDTSAYENYPRFQAFLQKVQSIFPKHSEAVAASPNKKILASRQEVVQPPVQFNFYDELPSMQVTVPAEGEVQVNMKKMEPKPASENTLENEMKTAGNAESSQRVGDNAGPSDETFETQQLSQTSANTSNTGMNGQDLIAASHSTDNVKEPMLLHAESTKGFIVSQQAKLKPGILPNKALTQDEAEASHETAADEVSDKTAAIIPDKPVEESTQKPSSPINFEKKSDAIAKLASQELAEVNLSEGKALTQSQTKSLLAEEALVIKYSLQLGEFETEAAAKRLVSALNEVGFKAKVVPITKFGRRMYEVQQGPFPSKEQAVFTQERMQKRGIVSKMLKTA